MPRGQDNQVKVQLDKTNTANITRDIAVQPNFYFKVLTQAFRTFTISPSSINQCTNISLSCIRAIPGRRFATSCVRGCDHNSLLRRHSAHCFRRLWNICDLLTFIAIRSNAVSAWCVIYLPYQYRPSQFIWKFSKRETLMIAINFACWMVFFFTITTLDCSRYISVTAIGVYLFLTKCNGLRYF